LEFGLHFVNKNLVFCYQGEYFLVVIVIVIVVIVIMGGFVSTYWSPLWDGEFADFTELEVQCNINSYSFNNIIIIIKNRMYIIV